jgi:hypothetical protein
MHDDHSLPNLNPGHIEGCRMHAVYSGAEDTPPVLIVVTCGEGCPHLSLELDPV